MTRPRIPENKPATSVAGGIASPEPIDVRHAELPLALRARERTAIRNVSLLLILRGLVLSGGLATAILVPRIMGPTAYGRYELVTMLTFWFTLLSGLGTGQVVTRQVPQLEHEGAKERSLLIFGNLLGLRILASFLAALLYLLVTWTWLREFDFSILLLLSAAILLRGAGSLCYSLFLGQGRIGRWAIPEVVRQWGSVTLALPCFLASGLHGAVIGYLVAEAGIFVVAITGARRSFSRWLLRPDWKTIVPLLQVGVVFYLGELVLSAVERSGGLMVRGLTHNYAEVGMFGVSHQIFTAAVASSNQISMSFVPLITVLRSRHEDAELKTWIERLIKWLALAGVLAFLGALILGQDIVPLVLGKAYVPVVSNLVVMVGALLFIPLTHSCSMLALTHDRPGIVFRAALLRLVVFWGAGITLTARWGSLGTCLALFLAIAAQMAFFVWKNRVVVAPAFLRWTLVVGVGLTFAPVAFLRSSRPANVALYLLTAGGFLLAMKALGQISAKDFRALVRALGRDRTTSKPDLPSVTSTI